MDGKILITAYAVCVAAALLDGCSTSSGKRTGDSYFTETKSRANVYAGSAQTKVLKIAVMPFKASTELIGSSVSDMVVTELLRTRKYSLVERSQMARVMSEAELALAGLSETKAVEVAKLMGAEAVVIGTVDEYGTQAKGGDTYAVVGLSIRLIDCSNGRIIWSADLGEVADDEDTPLTQHARAVVHELISGLFQNLQELALKIPPSPPDGVSVTEMGLREATVSWNRPSAEYKCRIERSVAETGPFAEIGTVPAGSGSYHDKAGLKDGAVYYYRVRFINTAEVKGDPSSVIETMTAPPPEAPENVTVSAPSSRCVELRWSAPKSDGITGYRVERQVAGSESWKSVGNPADLFFRDGGFKGCDVADSTVYRYRVSAVNRVGAVGAWSEPVEVKTFPPPAAVAGFTAPSREIRCVPLSWKENKESDVIGYEIECDDGGGAFKSLEKIKGRGETVFLHGDDDPGDLLDEHTYRYRIRAFNSVGSFSAWTEAKAVTKPAPLVPADVKATSDLPGRIRVTWKKNPEPDIVEYRVEAHSWGGMFWSKVGVTSECTIEQSDLKPAEARTYRVMAVGPKNHQSFWSAEISGTARPLPQPPTGLVAQKESDGGCRVTFAPPRDGMTGYKIYRKKFVGRDFIAESKEPAFVLSADVVGADGIDVVVTALDECGLESEPSAKLAVK